MAADAFLKAAVLDAAIVVAVNNGARLVLGRPAGGELAGVDVQFGTVDRQGICVAGGKAAVGYGHIDPLAFEGDARRGVITLPVAVVESQAALTGKYQAGALQVAQGTTVMSEVLVTTPPLS